MSERRGNIDPDEVYSKEEWEKMGQSNSQLLDIIQNPNALAERFNLSQEQAGNVKSLITGASAGLAHKYLSGLFGDEIAGAIGGYLGGYISRRLIGKRGA